MAAVDGSNDPPIGWPDVEPSTDSERISGPVDGPSPTIVGAVRRGVLDAELAGLLWVLADGGAPLIVAGPGSGPSAPADRPTRADLVEALLDLVPSARRRIVLDGVTEDFPWLSDVEGLGWVRSTAPAPEPADPRTITLLAGELGAGPAADLTGDRVRLVIRALGRRYGLLATIEAAGLEEVLATLRRRPISLTDDELSNLGVVVVLGAGSDGPAGRSGPRIVAAHYVRPLARDVHGHPQRLPPAVLATWDESTDRFEHFAWGVAGELAERVGRRAGDFEAEAERRAAVIAALAAGVDDRSDRPALRAFLEHQRALGAAQPGTHRH